VTPAQVRLRPLRPDELDTIAAQVDRVVAGGPGDARERLRERIARSGRFVDGRLDLAIEADGQLVGDISARGPAEAFPPGVVDVGISLLPEHRSRGLGTEAVRLMTDRLFREEQAERVQASTDVANAPMRRVLEKLGFVEEGVMRSFMPTGAVRADYVLYGVTRAEWLARD
jgi:RimJ/RimL family protein N-acetyltransferase